LKKFKYNQVIEMCMVREQDYDMHTLEEFQDICENCLNWKDFKGKCWYFWEKKKECSQKMRP